MYTCIYLYTDHSKSKHRVHDSLCHLRGARPCQERFIWQNIHRQKRILSSAVKRHLHMMKTLSSNHEAYAGSCIIDAITDIPIQAGPLEGEMWESVITWGWTDRRELDLTFLLSILVTLLCAEICEHRATLPTSTSHHMEEEKPSRKPNNMYVKTLRPVDALSHDLFGCLQNDVGADGQTDLSWPGLIWCDLI